MTRIFKYNLAIEDLQEIELPRGYVISDVQMQWSQLMLWAIVDPTHELVKAAIRIYNTGGSFELADSRYISTFQANNGAYVGHVFEVSA